MPEKNIHCIASLIAESCAKNPNDILFIGNNETSCSRIDFVAKTAARQASLMQYIDPGTRVLVTSHKGIDFFVDLFALWAIGAVPVPCDGSISAEEKIYFQTLLDAQPILPDTAVYSPAALGHTLKIAHCKPEQHAAILITSGSSGTPKGCLLNHRAVVGNCLAAIQSIEYDRKDRLFVNIPFHFTSAICHFLAIVLSGGTFIGMEERLLPADLQKQVSQTGANAFGGAPLQLRWLANSGQEKIPLLRKVISSGDHLAPEVITLLRKTLPTTNIYTVYGLTELGGRFCVLHPSLVEQFAGSVGKPIEGLTYTIRDPETFAPVPSCETGEIFVQGDYCFLEYYNNAVATEKTITPFGVRTGDLGHISPQGYLYVTGRSDDVFKVNGLKVSAIVVEQALMETGFFDDVAVVPRELPSLGLVPIACCVVKSDITFSKLEVLKKLGKQLPSNHIPASFVLRGEIPRTQSGKIRRRYLQSIIA